MIKIGGFLPQSMIDFPGKVTAVVFTQGCNFRCGFCHNPLLVLPELFHTPIPEIQVLESINNMKSWLDAVTISGGEPTIQSGLPRFLKEIKKNNLLIKLDTNGSNPDMIDRLIKEKLIDYVAMDIKTILEKDSYSKVIGIDKEGVIENIKKSLSLLREASIGFQLRTTIVPGFHSAEIIETLKNEFSYENYVQQEFRPGATVDTFSIID